jgi:hypothetical protein
MGRTPHNKIAVFAGKPEHRGQLVTLSIERSSGFTLYGDPVH